MLVFVIPLKSPKVSKSWEHTSKLFERCVKSVCNQTSPDFKVIVVCHEKPSIEFSHPHMTYVEVDLPIPSDRNTKVKDGYKKILKGLICAEEFQPTHAMVVDADDCVSKHLAEFVKQNPRSNGWFVNRGYVYGNGSILYLKRQNFYGWCGTCNIVRYDLHHLPEGVESIPNAYDYFFTHISLVEKMAAKGAPLEPLPFAGAVYNVDNTGDTLSGHTVNMVGISKTTFYRILNLRLLTRSIADEFGIYAI